MVAPQSREVDLPAPLSTPETTTVQTNGVLVIVGANGTGKSRLGVWLDLDSPQSALTHRVAAQRSLSIPPSTGTSSLDIAEKHLWYGWPDPRATVEHKRGNKWQGQPVTYLQSDFDQLLTFLFTEEFEVSRKYRQQVRASSAPGLPPDSKLDTIKRIWESVLSHRELVVEAGRIAVRAEGSDSLYNAGEMSDGERVVFYLIGQTLSAPPNGVLIIDEPEVHLHRAIQSRLWDAIEAERPDCLFIYLTHDLDFAATRVNATKIWLKSYTDGAWNWSVLPTSVGFPERLLLEVLGSRKPILFVEGERESLDAFLFAKVFPDHTVVPCGPADTVIHATASFTQLRHLHSLDCSGVIDRDFRGDEQVQFLRERRVFCLEVSEIENLLLTEGLLGAVAVSLHITDVAGLIDKIVSIVFEHLVRDRDRLISSIVAVQTEARLRGFDAKASGAPALAAAITSLASGIDVEELFRTTTTRVDDIIRRRDYAEALKIYNNKGLVPTVASLFGFKPNGLLDYIKRLSTSEDQTAIIAALRAGVPEIPS